MNINIGGRNGFLKSLWGVKSYRVHVPTYVIMQLHQGVVL
jgi:hypothetical protein